VNEIESRIQNSLGLSLLQPKSFPTKNDFGDLDLLGNFSARSPADVQIQIGAVGFVKNGAVTSYALPFGAGLFQVDLIHVPDHKLDFATRYMAWGGSGNFLGKVARYYGLKLTDDGLYAPWQPKSGELYFLPITRDFREALTLLRYDFDRFERGFRSEKDFLAFVQSSPLFDKAAFLSENMRHTDRVRERKRPMFETLKKLEAVKLAMRKEVVAPKDEDSTLSVGHYATPDGFQKLYSEYPLLREALSAKQRQLKQQENFSKKWNGDMVARITGLEKKELGDFMGEFSGRFGSSNASDVVLANSEHSMRSIAPRWVANSDHSNASVASEYLATTACLNRETIDSTKISTLLKIGSGPWLRSQRLSGNSRALCQMS
jgi:hypothetical protein